MTVQRALVRIFSMMPRSFTSQFESAKPFSTARLPAPPPAAPLPAKSPLPLLPALPPAPADAAEGPSWHDVKQDVDAKIESMMDKAHEWRNEMGDKTSATHHDLTISFNAAMMRLTLLGDYMSADSRRAKFMDKKKRSRVMAPIEDLIGGRVELNEAADEKPHAIAILNAIKDNIDAQLKC
jgi:hypothetical protein